VRSLGHNPRGTIIAIIAASETAGALSGSIETRTVPRDHLSDAGSTRSSAVEHRPKSHAIEVAQ
jgi:hypothetical protein